MLDQLICSRCRINGMIRGFTLAYARYTLLHLSLDEERVTIWYPPHMPGIPCLHLSPCHQGSQKGLSLLLIVVLSHGIQHVQNKRDQFF